jgi:hypothetical protein
MKNIEVHGVEIVSAYSNTEILKIISVKPKTQLTEVLYELITHTKHGCSTSYFVSSCFVLNPQDNVMRLRRMGLDVDCNLLKLKNKYGRPIKYGVYKITDVSKAVELYKKLTDA